MITVFKNSSLFDGHSETVQENTVVVVENDRIREVIHDAVNPPTFREARQIDCGGRVLMPGLIDAHIHAYAPSFSFYQNDRLPVALLVSHARRILEGMLQRGFTSVRDAGGGDRGL